MTQKQLLHSGRKFSLETHFQQPSNWDIIYSNVHSGISHTAKIKIQHFILKQLKHTLSDSALKKSSTVIRLNVLFKKAWASSSEDLNGMRQRSNSDVFETQLSISECSELPFRMSQALLWWISYPWEHFATYWLLAVITWLITFHMHLPHTVHPGSSQASLTYPWLKSHLKYPGWEMQGDNDFLCKKMWDWALKREKKVKKDENQGRIWVMQIVTKMKMYRIIKKLWNRHKAQHESAKETLEPLVELSHY